MNNVLLISPNEDWVTASSKFLSTNGLRCDQASNGKSGQLKAYKSQYDYIFLDLETQEHSATNVLKYLFSLKGKAKIFVIVMKSDLLLQDGLSEKSLLRLGASKILQEPTLDLLAEHIDALGKNKVWKSIQAVEANQSESSEEDIEDSEFTRVLITDFFEDVLAVTDFYLKLSNNRYIKIVNKGEQTTRSRFLKYGEAGTKYVYFPTKDRAIFVSYQNEFAKKEIQKKPAGSANTVIKAMKTANEKLVEEINIAGVKPALLEEGKAIFQNVYESAMKDKGLKTMLKNLEDFDPSAFSEAFLVAFFSTVICKNISWATARSIDSIALGSLLKDSGKMLLPAEVRDIDEAKLDLEQRKIFETHPILAVGSLANNPSVSHSVKTIILQHHEHVDGSGYPAGLTGIRIFPLAKVVSLADGFTHLMKAKNSAPFDTLKELLSDKKTFVKYEPELIKNLIKGMTN
jgi:response regulator RpfG family c-di-GMP phosphodiesterase